MSTNAPSGICLIHHATDGAQNIPLEPGTYRVGSHPDCALVLEHASVSEVHCEIEIGDERVVVRDLGSGTGTQIDGAPIQEDVLRPGQVLRVGEVEFSYQVAPAPRVNPVTRASTAWASPGVARPKSGPRKVPADATFPAQVSEAFGYPFRRDGLILLICGTIVFSLLEFAQMILGPLRYAGVFGLAYWIVIVMSGGYLFAFMQAIINSSAQGETEMPPWPEISNFFEDLVKPFFRFVVIGLACLGPGLILLVAVSPAVAIPVLLIGVFCLPMALLAVAMADGIGGLNPLVILSGIAKLPGQYVCVCLVFLAVLAVQRGGELVLEYSPIPLLPTVLTTFLTLYGLAVEMRLLGLLYYTNRERLAWFQ